MHPANTRDPVLYAVSAKRKYVLLPLLLTLHHRSTILRNLLFWIHCYV
jgi:hypothetical protein